MLRLKALLIAMTLSAPARAAPTPCAKVDTNLTDTDGNPLCPTHVKETSAFAVFRCANAQARSWHPPTPGEIGSMKAMLTAFKARDYAGMRKSADSVGLQTCRVINGDDKYLLFFAKYGVKDYNGPALILRDAPHVSKVWVIAPHVDSDGYFQAAPKSVQETKALALFQNGHPRGKYGRDADFSHTKNTLGWHAVKHFGALYPKSVVFHAHGMVSPSKVLYRPLKSPLAKPYENAIRKLTNITAFQGFNAFYEIDPPTVNTAWYVKTEIPVRIYRNQPMIMANIVKEWEKEPWAWKDQPTLPPEPEPEGGEAGEEPVEIEPELEGPAEECEGMDPEVMPPEPAAEPTVVPAPAPTPIVWHQKQKPQLGKRDLICAAVQYTSGPSTSLSACERMAKSGANFYKDQSRSRLQLHPKAVLYQSTQAAGGPGAAAAANYFRKKYPTALILLPNMWYAGSAHAGQRVAWLNKYGRDGGGSLTHELGHLLALGHCGRYVGGNPAEGNFGKLDHYGGGGCVMSGLAGNHLDPSQYIHIDWLKDSEYSVHDGIGTKEYELRKISAINGTKGMLTVVIPPVLMSGDRNGRAGYIAYSDKCIKDPCLAFYLALGGGSQRVIIFGKEFWHKPSGLRIRRLNEDQALVKISVTFDRATPSPL